MTPTARPSTGTRSSGSRVPASSTATPTDPFGPSRPVTRGQLGEPLLARLHRGEPRTSQRCPRGSGLTCRRLDARRARSVRPAPAGIILGRDGAAFLDQTITRDQAATLSSNPCPSWSSRRGSASPAEIQAVVEDYDEQLDEQLNVVIGERTVDWAPATTWCRVQETAGGNFFTDVMRTPSGWVGASRSTNFGGDPAGTRPTRRVTSRAGHRRTSRSGYRSVQAEISARPSSRHSSDGPERPDPDGGFLQVAAACRSSSHSSLAAGSRVGVGDHRRRSALTRAPPNDGHRVTSPSAGTRTRCSGTSRRPSSTRTVAACSNSFIIDYIESFDGPISTSVEDRYRRSELD